LAESDRPPEERENKMAKRDSKPPGPGIIHAKPRRRGYSFRQRSSRVPASEVEITGSALPPKKTKKKESAMSRAILRWRRRMEQRER